MSQPALNLTITYRRDEILKCSECGETDGFTKIDLEYEDGRAGEVIVYCECGHEEMLDKVGRFATPPSYIIKEGGLKTADGGRIT